MTSQTAEPWQWPEATWRGIVGRARAGRSLKPASWPEGARCAVALSFDADHETIPLRDGDVSPMRISQGQYGNRQGTPRIRRLLEREAIPATFFYPAVSALLHPDEIRAIAAGGHEIDALGHGEQSGLGHRHLLGLAAPTADAHHPVADGEPVGTVARGEDRAAELHTRDVGGPSGRGGVQAPPLQHVGPVESGRGHGHHHLARTGGGVGVLVPEQVPVDDGDSAHGARGPVWSSADRGHEGAPHPGAPRVRRS